MIATENTFENLLERIRNSHTVAVDTETTGLRPYHGDRLFSIVVGISTGSIYFNFIEYGLDEPVLDRSLIPEIYEAVRGKRIFFANAKFDMHMLCKEGWGTDFEPWDVLVIARCLYNRHMKYDLSSVAARAGFGTKDDVMTYIRENGLQDRVTITGKKTDTLNPRFDKVPFPLMSEYALKDGELTYNVGKYQEQQVSMVAAKLDKIKGYGGKYIPLIKREMELTKVLFDIERTGMEIDNGYLRLAIEHEEVRIAECRRNFERATGTSLTDSAKYLTGVFKTLGIEGGRTEKGNVSFTDEVLQKIDHEAAKILIEYRDAYKRLNTYYRGFAYHADREGIIRPNIKQSAADTFRFSITNPALQTLNSEDEGEWRVRDSFKSRHGYLLVSIDFQAQEFRLTADYAGETDLIKAINNGTDVHTATANLMGVDRVKAKTLNFMLLYGGGAQKLADRLGITLEEAKRLKHKYFSNLPRIAEFTKGVMNKVNERGYVFNFAGRTLFFPNIKFIKEDQEIESNFAYRGPNHIIQSSGSEIMRVSLINVHKFLKPYKSRIVLSVHDEIIYEVHETELHLIPQIQKIMEDSYVPKNGLPMKTSVAIGKSWGRLEDITNEEIFKRVKLQEDGSSEAEHYTHDVGVHHTASVH